MVPKHTKSSWISTLQKQSRETMESVLHLMTTTCVSQVNSKKTAQCTQ